MGSDDETKFSFAEAIPIDEFFESVEIRERGDRRCGANLFAEGGGDSVILRGVEFLFDLGDDGRKRAAAVTCLVLDSVPAIRIVAGGDDQAARGFALADEKRDCGSGARLVGEPDRRAGGAMTSATAAATVSDAKRWS